MSRARATLVWAALAAAVAAPIAAASVSPLLAWRDPVYIAAGFAGVLALGLLLVQPMLMSGYLPGPPVHRKRRAHRWIGGLLVASVVIHVAALWITSPPDVIDALLFRAPTAFSAWGVIAMWAVFATALMAALRRRLRPRAWRAAHVFLAAAIVVGTVIHAVLIEGTMETVSKAVLCTLVLAATMKVAADLLIRSTRTAPR